MGTSPFLTPSSGDPRRGERGRHRRRWRVAASILAVALAAGAVAVLTLATGSSAGHHARRAVARHPAPAPAAPALSPAGLALGKPAFSLIGLGEGQDVVHVDFHQPPRGGLLFDLDSGRVLWQRHATRQLPIASLTKMMTALLAVHSASPSTPVLITRQAVAEGGSKVGELPLGRHVSLEDLLYGLLLPSGNDAAVAIAQHVARTIPGFVARMNAEAAALGMGCTRFSSPSGFYDAGNFSCPADLALLAHVDLAQRAIARITRTYSAELRFPIKGGKLYLVNNNPLLIYGYPGTTGMKTGYTIASGRCLVATAERHGVRLGVILLHSPAPGTQARKLLDRAFHDVYHLPEVAQPPMPASA
jgi:D-alanyl-D-alanine carboxypeptidase